VSTVWQAELFPDCDGDSQYKVNGNGGRSLASLFFTISNQNNPIGVLTEKSSLPLFAKNKEGKL
jgi:hypothetical protein